MPRPLNDRILAPLFLAVSILLLGCLTTGCGSDFVQAELILDPVPDDVSDARVELELYEFDPDVADASATLISTEVETGFSGTPLIVSMDGFQRDEQMGYYITTTVDVNDDGEIGCADYVDTKFNELDFDQSEIRILVEPSSSDECTAGEG